MINDTLYRQCENLHQNYIRLSGRDKPWRGDCIFPWEAWTCRGWGLAELELVINYIKRKIEKHERRPESLKFSYIVCDLERFEDDLCEAKAQRGLTVKVRAQRKEDMTPAKVEILRATGRSVEPPDKVTTPAQVLSIPVAELVAAMRKAL